MLASDWRVIGCSRRLDELERLFRTLWRWQTWTSSLWDRHSHFSLWPDNPRYRPVCVLCDVCLSYRASAYKAVQSAPLYSALSSRRFLLTS